MVGMARVRWRIRRLYAGGNGCFYISPNKALKATARKRLKVIYAVMRDRVPYVA